MDDIVGLALAPSGAGYWQIGADGTVYSFGKVTNFGSATGTSSPVATIQSTTDGGGYWVVTQNGSVSAFGDAHGYGDLPNLGISPAAKVIGLVPVLGKKGYRLIGADGGVFGFPGGTPFLGSLPQLDIRVDNIVGAAPTSG